MTEVVRELQVYSGHAREKHRRLTQEGLAMELPIEIDGNLDPEPSRLRMFGDYMVVSAKSGQILRRRVSSLAIDCLRSPSPSYFFHQRFVNWHVKGRTKRNHSGWSRRGTSGISQAPHQNWLAESPVGKPRRTGYMLISFYHRRLALKEV